MLFQRNRTIHIQLSGRLGNQLFQQAYAHELARIFNCKIQPFFDKYHRPGLDSSDLVSGNFHCKHVQPAREMNGLGNLIRVFDKLGVFFNRDRISSLLSHAGIHRQVDSHLPGPKFLRKPWLVTGFFIDQKYAAKHEEVITKEVIEFSMKKCPVSENLDKIYGLGEYQIMHIRRGDFVNNEANFGLLNVEYYSTNRAEMPLVVAIENQSEILKFAEELKPDVILTKENSTVWETFLAFNSATDVVLSNSTFAWWGGFLASSNGAIVRIPEPFYSNQNSPDKFLRHKYFSSVQGIFGSDET